MYWFDEYYKPVPEVYDQILAVGFAIQALIKRSALDGNLDEMREDIAGLIEDLSETASWLADALDDPNQISTIVYE